MEDDEKYALSAYQVLRTVGKAAVADLPAETGLDLDQVERGIRQLRRLGLVRDVQESIEPVEANAALLGKAQAHQATAAAHAASVSDLEQLAHVLLTLYQPTLSANAPQAEVELITEPRLKDRRLQELGAGVKSSVDALHPGALPSMDVLNRSLAEDRGLVERGVRCRAMYRQALLENPKHARYLHDLAQAGVEIRLIDHAAYDLVVLDRLLAFIPAAPGTHSQGVALLRGSALVIAQLALYEDYWLRAVPYPRAVAQSERTALSAQERVVVRLMASGLSDDQIARKLGVHRRTVQRAVAKLMERLNATSRFEAGLKLARVMGADGDSVGLAPSHTVPSPRPARPVPPRVS
ncbi:helix-turn-helix transcriptional regulator [Streptomyces sp. NPDC088194]|uniref:helix-turn-helix transcriptional regulator n=1 Tax=Streptomyces sp. NPDC088194 TaxID=3154931 RepID=UPI00344E2A94